MTTSSGGHHAKQTKQRLYEDCNESEEILRDKNHTHTFRKWY